MKFAHAWLGSKFFVWALTLYQSGECLFIVSAYLQWCGSRQLVWSVIMRPSSLGGGHILRRTLSVCMSVCLSVCPSVPLWLPSVTSRHLANYNNTYVLFGRRRGPHIVRPSRPHKFLLFLVRVGYINDVLDIFLSPVNCKLYADDVKLYTELKTTADESCFQGCLDLLYLWSVTWQFNIW